ncbi:MAG: hypothetical protein GX927_06215 [Lentisphaerae bacterium]|nr:hypothetical protein [Lentisphaerota bacterium]
MDKMNKNGLLNGQWTIDDGQGWLIRWKDQHTIPQICMLFHSSKQQPL